MGKDPKSEFYLGGRRSEMSDSTREEYKKKLAEFNKKFPREQYATEVKCEWGKASEDKCEAEKK